MSVIRDEIENSRTLQTDVSLLNRIKNVDGAASTGSGTKLPDDTFIEYTVGQEPQELLDDLDYKTPEEQLTERKQQRKLLVSQITVEYNGVIYQGDEKSQDRLSRAINGLPDDSTVIEWIAKDNSTHNLNKQVLKDILFLCGSEQSRIWNEGRPQ